MSHVEQPKIRLIDVWKGRIKEYAIDKAPAYLAVSHLWSENLFPIEAKNGIRKSEGMKIIKKALMTNPDERDMHIWVDTYCIKQNDENDKAQQIRHMGGVYHRAALVLVVMKSKIPISSRELEYQSRYMDQYMDERGFPKPVLFALRGVALWQGLSDILRVAELPWFDRIWTAQEYILAKDIAWIDSAGEMLVIPPRFLSRLFTSWNVEKTLDEQAGSTAHEPFPWELDRLMHLDLLCRIREKEVSPMYSILISQWRESVWPQDKIYGLMGGTGVNITADYSRPLEQIWPQWFEQSLSAGHSIWLASPRTYDHRTAPGAMASRSNCIMPAYQYASKALADTNLMDLTPFPHNKPIKVKEGSVGLFGKIIGTCVLDTFFGCVGFGRSHTFQSWAEEIGHAAKGNPETATRILNVLITSGLGSRTHAEAAEQICSFLYVLEAGAAETRKRKDLFTVAEKLFKTLSPPSYSSLHLMNGRTHDRVYLGTIHSQHQTRDILVSVQHDDPGASLSMAETLEEATMMAIDVNAICRRREERVLIIACPPLSPTKSSHRNPLHKLGVTYPVRTRTVSKMTASRGSGNTYVIDAPLERIWLGGNHCSQCELSSPNEPEEVTEVCNKLRLREEAWKKEQYGPLTRLGVHNYSPSQLASWNDLQPRNERMKAMRGN